MRRSAPAALLLLAACTHAQPPPPPEAVPTGPVVTLAGEWRVAGIDGKPFDEAYGLALSADADTIQWEPSCAGQARRYTIDGTRIAFEPTAQELASRRAGAPPRIVCQIGLPERLPQVMAALDAATRIERTPQNGILISGGGRSVTLFSQ